MDPSRIQDLLATNDLQETSRLHERRVAKPAHFQQLLSAAKRSVPLPMLVHAPRGELVHARNVTQQRRTCAVQIDADEAHARLDHIIQCVAKMLRPRVMLVQPDTDTGWINLDQLAER